MCSRDRSASASKIGREPIARTPPPAFLFPYLRCQRPDRRFPTPPFSARRRRGAAYLVAPFFRVNRLFRKKFRSSLPLGQNLRRSSVPARSGVSIEAPFRCQSALSSFLRPAGEPEIQDAKTVLGRRGASLKIQTIRLRLRCIPKAFRCFKSDLRSLCRTLKDPVRGPRR